MSLFTCFTYIYLWLCHYHAIKFANVVCKKIVHCNGSIACDVVNTRRRESRTRAIDTMIPMASIILGSSAEACCQRLAPLSLRY
ncbi:hypothetical protein B0O99DRAFT_611084, partial [Bisporella sp. PMI_857]